MSKKSQFYIVTALILLAVTFSIYPSFLRPTKPVTVFDELSANFEVESPKVVNNALYRGNEPGAVLRNFTTEFLAYAKTRDPDFRLLYVFAHNSSIEIGNYLVFQVNASTNSSSILVGPNNNGVVPLSAVVSVKVNNFNYKFANLTGSGLVLKSLFRSRKDRETKVHVTD